MLNINFQNSSSPKSEEIITFHDWLFSILLPVITGYMLFRKRRQFTDRTLTSSERIETIWILVPAGMLMLIAVPSLRLLYLVEERRPRIIVKAQGYQWFWGYDNPFGKFDSFAIFAPSISYQGLDCDLRLGVPLLEDLQVLVTSTDVIHSWTLPTMGVKGDAVPGRINRVSFTPKRPGVYYGQCREICGANHRIMPINMECYIPIPPKPVEMSIEAQRSIQEDFFNSSAKLVGEREPVIVRAMHDVVEAIFGKD